MSANIQGAHEAGCILACLSVTVGHHHDVDLARSDGQVLKERSHARTRCRVLCFKHPFDGTKNDSMWDYSMG